MKGAKRKATYLRDEQGVEVLHAHELAAFSKISYHRPRTQNPDSTNRFVGISVKPISKKICLCNDSRVSRLDA
jgi:hypothetical protein